jgi:nucleotide-binding universal stress UspA family protein
MSFASGLKTIVVATELTGRSEAALEYARKLAAAYGARIVLAHGIDPMEYAEVDSVPGRVLKLLPEEARAVLDKLSGELLREGIPSHSELRQGAVAQMLLDVVRQYQAGLIVIGTKGMEGAGPVIVGAIAEQLVRLAPCPVLAVAADWNAGGLSPHAGRAGAAGHGAQRGCRSGDGNSQFTGACLRAPPAAASCAHAGRGCGESGPLRATLEEFGVESQGAFPVRCIVKDGNPADAIVEGIAENHPCILVAGVKRLSGTPGPHGTAFALLARSRVPVLCVPPE